MRRRPVSSPRPPSSSSSSRRQPGACDARTAQPQAAVAFSRWCLVSLAAALESLPSQKSFVSRCGPARCARGWVCCLNRARFDVVLRARHGAGRRRDQTRRAGDRLCGCLRQRVRDDARALGLERKHLTARRGAVRLPGILVGFGVGLATGRDKRCAIRRTGCKSMGIGIELREARQR